MDNYYEQYGAICKAIVKPIRLQIIETIGEGKLNVSQLQEKLSLSMSNLSNHLSALYNVGVLQKEKKGNYIYYFLAEPQLLKVLLSMREVISSITIRKDSNLLTQPLSTGEKYE
jgi:ArsR family transcriptional regulator